MMSDLNFSTQPIQKGTLLLSNSIEVLFAHLKENLFSENGLDDIFAEKMLVVPSQGIQQWIQMHLASSLSISSGFNSTFLNKGIDILRERLFCVQKNCFLPSPLELFLRVEQEIDQAMHSTEPIWQPLITYVKGKERRKISLAKQLAQLFARYGIYGNRACREWEAKPNNWQEALWSNIFKEWGYPQRALLRLQEKKFNPGKLSVHLFAFSHLSPLHFHFFCRAARQIPVYFYQLSPCQEFWSDLNKLEGHNTLLVSMGKVGREMARLIEEGDTPSEEAYIFFGGHTQLRKLQRDLLSLQTSDGVVSDDDSIQIHSAATPHREIENLHRLLLTILSKTGTEPKDILVMAPQITIYAPYIEAIFGHGPEKIDYQIADMPLQRSHPLVEGLFLLLDLEKRRWSTTAVFELFNHPLFRKKQRWSEEDSLQIRKWAQKTGVRWAVNGEHRASLLKKGHCKQVLADSTATWLEGLGHLVEELALPSLDPTRPQRIDFSQAEILGDTIVLINTLHADLKALESEKTLQEWGAFLKKLLETYFVLPEDSKILLSTFVKIELAGRHFPDKRYRFSLIYTLLKDYLSQESTTVNRNACQAIRFCSMLPMRALPAKIICIIGMNHDAFPRKEELGQLDLLKQNALADYAPSRIDFDRHLFLEALISAREKLIISYLGQDPFDLTELPPSSVVTELLPFVSQKQIIKHSIHNLDHVRINPPPPFSIKVNPKITFPKGEYVIEAAELSRLVRSGLSHYLYGQEIKIFEEETLQEEEPFSLSPLHKAIIRKKALWDGSEVALLKAKREGMLPTALFGTLAKIQLKEEVRAFPKEKLTRIELPPFQLKVDSSLTVSFTGSIEGVYSEGLCIPYKSDFKNAVKAWPNYLLLNAIDRSKTNLLFAASNELRLNFFDDPCRFLLEYINFYFFAKENPLLLIPEWVEPILKRDPKKLEQAPIYDSLLQWQLKGRGNINYENVMEECSPFVDKLYKEMSDAWF